MYGLIQFMGKKKPYTGLPKNFYLSRFGITIDNSKNKIYFIYGIRYNWNKDTQEYEKNPRNSRNIFVYDIETKVFNQAAALGGTQENVDIGSGLNASHHEGKMNFSPFILEPSEIPDLDLIDGVETENADSLLYITAGVDPAGYGKSGVFNLDQKSTYFKTNELSSINIDPLNNNGNDTYLGIDGTFYNSLYDSTVKIIDPITINWKYKIYHYGQASNMPDINESESRFSVLDFVTFKWNTLISTNLSACFQPTIVKWKTYIINYVPKGARDTGKEHYWNYFTLFDTITETFSNRFSLLGLIPMYEKVTLFVKNNYLYIYGNEEVTFDEEFDIYGGESNYVVKNKSNRVFRICMPSLVYKNALVLNEMNHNFDIITETTQEIYSCTYDKFYITGLQYDFINQKYVNQKDKAGQDIVNSRNWKLIEFHPETDFTIKDKSLEINILDPYPFHVWYNKIVAVGTDVYAIGGKEGIAPMEGSPTAVSLLKFDTLNPSFGWDNTYFSLNSFGDFDLDSGFYGFDMKEKDGIIYIVGGVDSKNEDSRSTVYIYDTNSSTGDKLYIRYSSFTSTNYRNTDHSVEITDQSNYEIKIICGRYANNYTKSYIASLATDGNRDEPSSEFDLPAKDYIASHSTSPYNSALLASVFRTMRTPNDVEYYSGLITSSLGLHSHASAIDRANKIIYFYGGIIQREENQYIKFISNRLYEYKYDTSHHGLTYKTINEISREGKAVYGHSMVIYNNKLYIGPGQCGNQYPYDKQSYHETTPMWINQIQVYDILNDSWEFHNTNLPFISHYGMTLVNNVIHIVGGKDLYDKVLDTHHTIDLTQTPGNEPIGDSCAALIEHDINICGAVEKVISSSGFDIDPETKRIYLAYGFESEYKKGVIVNSDVTSGVWEIDLINNTYKKIFTEENEDERYSNISYFYSSGGNKNLITIAGTNYGAPMYTNDTVPNPLLKSYDINTNTSSPITFTGYSGSSHINTVNGKKDNLIYFGGGRDYTSSWSGNKSLYKYDINTQEIINLDQLPYYTAGTYFNFYNNKLWYFGGSQRGSITTAPYYIRDYFVSIDEIDTTQQSVIQLKEAGYRKYHAQWIDVENGVGYMYLAMGYKYDIIYAGADFWNITTSNNGYGHNIHGLTSYDEIDGVNLHVNLVASSPISKSYFDNRTININGLGSKNIDNQVERDLYKSDGVTHLTLKYDIASDTFILTNFYADYLSDVKRINLDTLEVEDITDRYFNLPKEMTRGTLITRYDQNTRKTYIYSTYPEMKVYEIDNTKLYT